MNTEEKTSLHRNLLPVLAGLGLLAVLVALLIGVSTTMREEALGYAAPESELMHEGVYLVNYFHHSTSNALLEIVRVVASDDYRRSGTNILVVVSTKLDEGKYYSVQKQKDGTNTLFRKITDPIVRAER